MWNIVRLVRRRHPLARVDSIVLIGPTRTAWHIDPTLLTHGPLWLHCWDDKLLYMFIRCRGNGRSINTMQSCDSCCPSTPDQEIGGVAFGGHVTVQIGYEQESSGARRPWVLVARVVQRWQRLEVATIHSASTLGYWWVTDETPTDSKDIHAR